MTDDKPILSEQQIWEEGEGGGKMLYDSPQERGSGYNDLLLNPDGTGSLI